MEREVIWVAREGPGLEHLYLRLSEEGPAADGLVIGLEEDRPFRVAYEIRCDAQWRVREMRVGVPGSEWPSVDLLADGEGSWTTRAGDSVPGLKGCVDVDISATPFTNTLPIRRLGLGPGKSAELVVAYVDVPQLWVGPERQRYRCLEASANDGIYRFETIPGGFTADIPGDSDGLVVDYPGLFRRVWSG